MMYLIDKDMSPIMPRHQSHNASGRSKRVRIIDIIMLTKKDFSEINSFFFHTKTFASNQIERKIACGILTGLLFL